jgi:hypothetical protein
MTGEPLHIQRGRGEMLPPLLKETVQLAGRPGFPHGGWYRQPRRGFRAATSSGMDPSNRGDRKEARRYWWVGRWRRRWRRFEVGTGSTAVAVIRRNRTAAAKVEECRGGQTGRGRAMVGATARHCLNDQDGDSDGSGYRRRRRWRLFEVSVRRRRWRRSRSVGGGRLDEDG